MNLPLLTRRRMALDQEVREPTLLAFALTVVGLVAVLAGCILMVVGLPVFGYTGWAFAVASMSLAWLVLGLRGRPGLTSPTARQRWLLRILGVARFLFIGVLAAVQAYQTPETDQGDQPVLIQFAGLVVALALLMQMPIPELPR